MCLNSVYGLWMWLSYYDQHWITLLLFRNLEKAYYKCVCIRMCVLVMLESIAWLCTPVTGLLCCLISKKVTKWYHFYSFKYIQQDATLYNILYCCQCSTCFRQFFRPSSGAQTVYTASGICQACLVLPLVWVSCQLTHASGSSKQA